MKTNERQPVVTSVKIGGMEMAVSEQSLADLCKIKQDSGVYSHAIDRVIRKLIDVGVCDESDDKSDYIFLLRDLQDMREHYNMIAGLQLMKDGENVVPVE